MGELGAERKHESGRPDRVAAEEREEPRRAGGQEDEVGSVDGRHAQRVEVSQRSREPARKPLVVSADSERRPPRRKVDPGDDGLLVARRDRPGDARLPVRRHDDGPAQFDESSGCRHRRIRSVEPNVHGLARPAGLLTPHPDLGTGGRLEPGLDPVHVAQVCPERDDHFRRDALVEVRRDRESLLDGSRRRRAGVAGTHLGVGGPVVEVPQERHETHRVRAERLGRDVLTWNRADDHRQLGDDPDIREVEAVDGRLADRAVPRRPGLSRRAKHDEFVVQKGLQGCGHVLFAAPHWLTWSSPIFRFGRALTFGSLEVM